MESVGNITRSTNADIRLMASLEMNNNRSNTVQPIIDPELITCKNLEYKVNRSQLIVFMRNID